MSCQAAGNCDAAATKLCMFCCNSHKINRRFPSNHCTFLHSDACERKKKWSFIPSMGQTNSVKTYEPRSLCLSLYKWKKVQQHSVNEFSLQLSPVFNCPVNYKFHSERSTVTTERHNLTAEPQSWLDRGRGGCRLGPATTLGNPRLPHTHTHVHTHEHNTQHHYSSCSCPVDALVNLITHQDWQFWILKGPPLILPSLLSFGQRHL